MDVLKTNNKKCLICKTGDIVEKNRSNTKDGFMVYGRNGSRPAIHVESRCNSTNFDCGAGYYHGYMTYKGMKILHDDALKSQVLVTSNQTGFDIEYLVELVSCVQIISTTFEGAAKEFNRFHNRTLPMDVQNKRVEIFR